MGNAAANAFNPANKKFNRGLQLGTMYIGGFLCLYSIVLDDSFGTEHVFSPLQRYAQSKLDKYYHVTEEDLQKRSVFVEERRKELLENDKRYKKPQ